MISKIFFYLKKMIKLFLPYGVIRCYQFWQHRNDHIMNLLEKNYQPVHHSESDKKVVLYDASLIAYNWHQDQGRRGGLYFVAYHILTQMSKSNHYDIKVYSHRLDNADIFCDSKHFKNLQNFLNYEKLSNVSMLKFPKIGKILYWLSRLSNYMHIKLLVAFFCSLKDKIVKDSFYFDIYFSPYHKVPDVVQKNQYIKKYTIFHDTVPILYPWYYNNGWFSYTFFSLFNSLNQTDHYFTNSESTKRDFLRFSSKLSSEQIQVSLLGVSSNFYPCPEKRDEVLKKYNIDSNMKYTFMLGAVEPRKNLIRIIRTLLQFTQKHSLDNFVLLIGGATVWRTIFKTLQDVFQGLDQEKIIFLGYVDDEDLAPLYSGAEFFVYTSQYEGFGLPPLEAMKCGCPVITSNNSSLPEVVGDAGIMIDYDSDEQHIQAYEKYYFDKEYANEMREKGLKRAEQFTWEKCFDIIDHTLEEHCK